MWARAAGKAAAQAGRALPVAGGAAVAIASSSSGAALADARPVEAPLSPLRLQEEWELADVSKDTVIFSPEEVDGAFAALGFRPRPAAPSSSCAVVEELDSELSSDSSADAILERPLLDSSISGSGGVLAGLPLDMCELATLASRLLKSPGVQREICCAALSDPEVFSILASKVDLPEYLAATGFAAKGLLGAPEADSSSSSSSSMDGSDAQQLAEGDADSPNPLVQLSAAVADGVERIGNAVAALGRWMRCKLTGTADTAAADAAEGATGAAAGNNNRSSGAWDGVMGAVMVLCVAVVAVIVMRRPGALRKLLRRRATPRRA